MMEPLRTLLFIFYMVLNTICIIYALLHRHFPETMYIFAEIMSIIAIAAAIGRPIRYRSCAFVARSWD